MAWRLPRAWPPPGALASLSPLAQGGGRLVVTAVTEGCVRGWGRPCVFPAAATLPPGPDPHGTPGEQTGGAASQGRAFQRRPPVEALPQAQRHPPGSRSRPGQCGSPAGDWPACLAEGALAGRVSFLDAAEAPAGPATSGTGPPRLGFLIAQPPCTHLRVGGEAAAGGKRGGGRGVRFLPASSFPWRPGLGSLVCPPPPAQLPGGLSGPRSSGEGRARLGEDSGFPRAT